MTAEEISLKALDGLEPNVLDDFEVSYRCDCNRTRVQKALVSLGKEQLLDLAKEENTEVKCHFCDKVYNFSSNEVKQLIKD